MITYTWSFDNMLVEPDSGTLQNVIKMVYWSYMAQDAGMSVSFPGATELAPPATETFTPFEAVTYTQTVEWVEQAIGQPGLQELQARLAQELDKKINPVVETVSPPWLSHEVNPL